MLIQLTVEQVTDRWDEIRDILKSEGFLPVKILEDLMLMRSHLWIVSDKGDVKGFLITRIITEDFTGNRLLWVDFLYTLEIATKRVYLEAIENLMEYAGSKACTSIGFNTVNDGMVKLFKRLGASSEFRVILPLLSRG